MKKIRKEDLVQDVLKVYKEEERISRDLYLAKGQYSRKPIERIFGNWNNMLKELNIPLNQKVVGENKFVYTDEELLEDLVKIYNEFGYCSAKLIKDNSISCIEVYQRRFGSINKAFQKVGIPTRKAGERIEEDGVVRLVESILDIKFEREKTFDWLVNPETGRHLYLDGYYEPYNLALEYNGPQHFQIANCFANKNRDKKLGTTALERTRQRDKAKRELLLQHNVKLLNMNYYEPINRLYLIDKISELNIESISL